MKLSAIIGVDTKQAELAMVRFKGFMKSSAAGIAGALGLGLGAREVASFFSNLADEGDKIAKTAKKFGISATEFQRVTYAAERSGAEMSTVEQAYKKLPKVINDASRGMKTSQDAIKSIGLSWQELEKMSPEQQFNAVAKAISSLENESKKTAIAQELLGRAGADLIPMLADFDNLKREAEDAGIFSEEEIKAAENFKDAMLDIDKSIKSIAFNSGAISLMANSLAQISDYVSGKTNKTIQKDKGKGVYATTTDEVSGFIANAAMFGYASKLKDKVVPGARYSTGAATDEELKAAQAVRKAKLDAAANNANQQIQVAGNLAKIKEILQKSLSQDGR